MSQWNTFYFYFCLMFYYSRYTSLSKMEPGPWIIWYSLLLIDQVFLPLSSSPWHHSFHLSRTYRLLFASLFKCEPFWLNMYLKPCMLLLPGVNHPFKAKSISMLFSSLQVVFFLLYIILPIFENPVQTSFPWSPIFYLSRHSRPV